MTDETLIARLEAATELTLELFLEAQATLRPDISDHDWGRSYAMALAEAYEIAALTLVGGESGLGSLIAGNFPDGSRGWVARVRRPETADGEGKTPALAIVIAALRAKAGEG